MPSRDPRQRFVDIIDNIDAIRRSTNGLSREQFLADADKYDATERRLARISEAAVKLGLLAEELLPDQPWSEIRGLGNWLRHDYPGTSVGGFGKPCETISILCARTVKRRSRSWIGGIVAMGRDAVRGMRGFVADYMRPTLAVAGQQWAQSKWHSREINPFHGGSECHLYRLSDI